MNVIVATWKAPGYIYGFKIGVFGLWERKREEEKGEIVWKGETTERFEEKMSG